MASSGPTGLGGQELATDAPCRVPALTSNSHCNSSFAPATLHGGHLPASSLLPACLAGCTGSQPLPGSSLLQDCLPKARHSRLAMDLGVGGYVVVLAGDSSVVSGIKQCVWGGT